MKFLRNSLSPFLLELSLIRIPCVAYNKVSAVMKFLGLVMCSVS